MLVEGLGEPAPEARPGGAQVPRLALASDPLQPSRSGELGATWDGAGTTFNVRAPLATRVTLVLVEADGTSRECDLRQQGDSWGGWIAGVAPGQRYGYRVDGPWDPGRGVRHNRDKLLLDPYARQVTGTVGWGPEVYDFRFGAHGVERSPLDSAGHVPLGVVVDHRFDWQGDRSPDVPRNGLIYEAHVKGSTIRNTRIPAKLRGTYLGLAHPEFISHLKKLNVRCVELMPVHAFIDQQHQVANGLRNYWGYDPIGWFAPEQRFASDPMHPVEEFKTMVRELHRQGMQVIIDVVYNHTAEGGAGGPTLSLKGLDNRGTYRLHPADASQYVDITGCANTVDLSKGATREMVLASLRYWVTEMHVDGFRFDEASVLPRDAGCIFRPDAEFFAEIRRDPILSKVRVISESWDCSLDPYHLGEFPAPWGEWNGRFRDTVRDFWRHQSGGVADLATRLTGSADLYGHNGRDAAASVNAVTFHDGFTLRDLTMYDVKHNEKNGEDNRDGVNENRSWNHGVEGPTADPVINARREQTQRNMLATLLLSRGTPLLLHGDEMGRTQGGNNNAYNQDNEISWVDWDHADQGLLDFTARLGALREREPLLTGTGWLADSVNSSWWTPWQHLAEGDWRWHDPGLESLGLLLQDRSLSDHDLLLLFHSADSPVDWAMPPGGDWEVVLDSAAPAEPEGSRRVASGGSLHLGGPSVVVLRRRS